MKRYLIIIIWVNMLTFLFADCQCQYSKRKFDALKARQSIMSSMHPSGDAFAPLPISNNIKASPESRDRSQVQGVNPDRAWWGDEVVISGINFSWIANEDVVHFNPVPTIANSANGTWVSATIPEGARSSYPIVTQSGLAGTIIQGEGNSLKIVAKGINFKYIRSIVEDRDNHYIYIGFADSLPPKIAKVDLYHTVIPAPTYIDADCTSIRPYLSRMVTEGSYKGEICYIKNYISVSYGDIPAVFCFKEGIGPHWVADLRDSNFNGSLQDISAFDATADGQHFFVADWTTGSTHGHIIHVERDNASCINSNWGNIQNDFFHFFIDHRRTGLAAYNDSYVGLSVLVSTESTDPNPSDACYKGFSGSCIWIVNCGNIYKFRHINNKILDIEVDREISRKYPDVTKNYFYFMTGASTLASDTVHDFRGFVDAINTPDPYPPDPRWDSLMLNTNTTSYFVARGLFYSYRPSNNQNEVVISDNPLNLDWSTHWPLDEQDKAKLIKFTIHGWASIPYYLRILDPRDYSGYAPINPPARYIADHCRSANYDPQGPFLNACDNRNWDCVPNYLFGFCNTDDYCSTPGLMLGTTMPGGDYTAEKDVYLYLPAQYAGDNLMVQMSELPIGNYGDHSWPNCSAAPDVTCKMPVDAYSGVYTGWKRIPMEYDNMYRYGAPLRQNLRQATCGTLPCNEVLTYLWTEGSDIRVGDQIWVYNRPANPPDHEVDPDCPNAPLPGSLCEVATVQTIFSLPCPDHNETFCRTYMLDHQLTKDYLAAYVYPHGQFNLPDFTNQNSAGVALYRGLRYLGTQGTQMVDCTDPQFSDQCYYKIKQPFDFEKTFNDAYVFFETRDWADGNGSGAVPLLPVEFAQWAHLVDDYSGQLGLFSRIWFYNCPNQNCEQINYFHLIGAGDGAPYYEAESFAPHNFSYVFVRTIEQMTFPDIRFIASTNHELAHQFDVDCCDIDYHNDIENAWCSGQESCSNPNYQNIEWALMHIGRCPPPPPDACQQEDISMHTDGIDELRLTNFLIGTENYCENPTDHRQFQAANCAIRTAMEPL